MTRYSKIAALALALTTAGTVAHAAAGGANDALSVANAQIPLSKAVTTAEQHVGGKASRAEYEDTKQGWAYDVEVVSGKQVFDVKVDARTGAVLASTADKADHQDEEDEDHEDHERDARD